MDHCAILAKGIEYWNLWRSHHPNLTCTLEGADLRQGYFIGGNFRHVNLKGANLHAADLKNADLTGADLTGADLTGADLTSTYLDGAIFYEANLSSANLARAVLDKTDLRAANLTHTWLVETDIRSVMLTELSNPYPIQAMPSPTTPAPTAPALVPPAIPAQAVPIRAIRAHKARRSWPLKAIPAFTPAADSAHFTERSSASNRFMSRLEAFTDSDRKTQRLSRSPSRQQTTPTSTANHFYQIAIAKRKIYIL